MGQQRGLATTTGNGPALRLSVMVSVLLCLLIKTKGKKNEKISIMGKSKINVRDNVAASVLSLLCFLLLLLFLRHSRLVPLQ